MEIRSHRVPMIASNSRVKLCRRDLIGVPYWLVERFISQEDYNQLYHNFVWIDGHTFGFTTGDKTYTERCIVEGPGKVEEDLTEDIWAAASGSMHGSCQDISCNNPARLLEEAIGQANFTRYYYCLSYDPLNNESGGINCQEWATMMLRTYCY